MLDPTDDPITPWPRPSPSEVPPLDQASGFPGEFTTVESRPDPSTSIPGGPTAQPSPPAPPQDPNLEKKTNKPSTFFFQDEPVVHAGSPPTGDTADHGHLRVPLSQPHTLGPDRLYIFLGILYVFYRYFIGILYVGVL